MSGSRHKAPRPVTSGETHRKRKPHSGGRSTDKQMNHASAPKYERARREGERAMQRERAALVHQVGDEE